VSEALRRLLQNGRVTLVPNAAGDGLEGAVQFKGLGEHLLEMSGWTRRVGERKAKENKKKLSGSGGVSCISSTPEFLDISLR
jgi:hypothetical protein